MVDETPERSGEPISRRQALAITAGSAAILLRSELLLADAKSIENEVIETFDVVIVGGGPAGLSAALVLGRACRKVLLCDAGQGRNAPASGVHGFFTQDGTPPAELRRIGRDQLKPYDVELRDVAVNDARKVEDGFEVTLEEGGRVACRKLILATGLVDDLPEIEGLKAFWGTGVILCPYCHGWEFRDRPWAFMVPAEYAVEMATLLLGWTKRLTLLTNGPSAVSAVDRTWLAGHSIEVVEERIERLVGRDGVLAAVELRGGRRLDISVLQMKAGLRQKSPLTERLGCEIVTEGPTAGMVKTDAMGATQVKGLFVIGDASVGAPSVAVAVAKGSMAAAMSNRDFLMDAARPTNPGA